MKKNLLIMILLLMSFSFVMAQQANDPKGEFAGQTVVTGEALKIDFQALIPDYEFVAPKSDTVPPVGFFNYKLKDEYITEKSMNLIKNWRKESK
ncbi:MAG TPA: hypothetical protein PL124_05625 [Candidatus Cloacimonadota bacterium]|nr:hypothetical protein [Candidatus Cloacimonadota bacterium]HPS38876.1 hypothetical protein [Candidatus Cloacimonadota bacterium]